MALLYCSAASVAPRADRPKLFRSDQLVVLVMISSKNNFNTTTGSLLPHYSIVDEK
jgi:hypothetical protein